MSQVRVNQDPIELKQNPYAPPTVTDTREVPENLTPHREPAAGSAKISVIPMLAFVVFGLILGHFFVSPAILPPSRHVLQQFRGAAIGALLGVLMYAMMEYFFPREE